MNVGAFLTKAARVHPTRVAVTDGSRVLRYAELDAQAAAFADGLRRRGYAAGDRVVIFMANRLEYFTVLFGLFKGGLVAVPVNAKLHASELGFILEHARPRAVVYSAKTSDTVEAGLLATAGVERIDVDRQGPSSLAAIAADGDAAGLPTQRWTRTMRHGCSTVGHHRPAEGSDAVASQPLHERDQCAGGHLRLPARGCGAACGAAVAWIGPLRAALRSHGRRRTSSTWAGRSTPRTCWRRPLGNGSPSWPSWRRPWQSTCCSRPAASTRISSLRRVVYGGGPIDGLAAAAIERFGPVFVQLYGMGESPMTIPICGRRIIGARRCRRPGSRTDVEVRLVDESGAAVAEGSRARSAFAATWSCSPTGTTAGPSRALSAGWLHTGDIGRFEDGYLYLVARKSDVIISGGSNIYPREVEDVLLLHPR